MNKRILIDYLAALHHKKNDERKEIKKNENYFNECG